MTKKSKMDKDELERSREKSQRQKDTVSMRLKGRGSVPMAEKELDG